MNLTNVWFCFVLHSTIRNLKNFKTIKEKGAGRIAKIKGTSADKSVLLKSVQSTLSHLMTTSVPRAMLTHFLVEHGLFQYYLY